MRKGSKVLALLLSCTMLMGLWVFFPTSAYAATVGSRSGRVNNYDDPAGAIYVDANANLSNANGSYDRPYRSINTALSNAPAGSTIVLRNGTYREGINVRVQTQNITIKSAKGEWAVIDLTNYNSGHNEDSAVYFYPGSNGSKLQGVEVIGGFYAVGFETKWDWGQADRSGASNIIIEDCVLHDSRNDCVKIKPNCDNITIRYNEIYNSGRAYVNYPDFTSGERNSEGIDNVNGDNMQVDHNYIHDICSNAIYAKGGAINAIIEYNRIEKAFGAGIMIGFDSSPEYFDTGVNPQYYENIGGIVRNNLIIHTGWEGIGFYSSQNGQAYSNTLVDVNYSQNYHSAIYFGIATQDEDPNPNLRPPTVNPSFHHNIVSQPAEFTRRPMLEIRYIAQLNSQLPISLSGLDGMPTMNNNCYYIAGRNSEFHDMRPNTTLNNGNLTQWTSHINGDNGSIEVNPALDPTTFRATNSQCVSAGMGIPDELKVGPGGGGTPPTPPSSSKDITSFSISGIAANISGTAITLTMPAGTNVTSLTPSITHTGASISPTGARNFTNPVTYTVTAADGSTKSYTATVSVASGPDNPPPVNPPTPALPADGLYTISAKCAPGMVLDVSGGSYATGANIQLWADNTTPAQTFRLTRIGESNVTLTNVASGKVLDVSGAGQASGTNVQQWDANGTNAQKWQLVSTGDGDGSWYLKSLCNGLYLDVAGASNKSGANVWVYAKNSTNAQKFYFKSINAVIAPGNYTISSALGGSRRLVVDIAGGSTANAANVWLWESNNTGAQKFRLNYNAQTGYYTIVNIQSGLVLDVAGASSASGTNVWQYASNGTRAQLWRIESNGSDGTYRIISATGNGCCLDISGAKTANGTNIQIYTSNGTNAQRWRFIQL